MSFWLLAARSMLRNKVRTVLTVLAMSATLCAFVLLRTSLAAYTSFAETAAADRLILRARGGAPLPLKHLELVRGLPGVQAVSHFLQISGSTPKKPTLRLGILVVDAPTLRQVFDELVVPEDQHQRWVANRSGALVGRDIADELEVSPGDSLTLVLRGGLTVPVQVEGIYSSTEVSGVQHSSTLIHHELVNEMLPPHQRDRAIYNIRAVDEAQATLLITNIVETFERRGTIVDVDSERGLARGVVERAGSLLAALNVTSVGVLLLMLLIISNTMAMTIRERTSEMGMLRAVGFRPYHLSLLVVAEAIVTALVASALGVAIGYPLVTDALPKLIAAVMGSVPPRWPTQWDTYLWASLATTIASVIGVAIPGYRAATMPVNIALRHVD